jgi:hypothetical protein
MNAYDFAHSMGRTHLNPLEQQQIKAIEAKLLNFTKHVSELAISVIQDPVAKKNLESIFEKVFDERKLRIFYGFKADDCERMEGLVVELQRLFNSAYPGLIKFKEVLTPKNARVEPQKLLVVERVDESLLKESLAYLSIVNDPKLKGKEINPDDKKNIRQLLGKVVARLNDYPADMIPDEILENMARLFENMNNVLIESEYSVFRLCVERNIAVPKDILEQMLKRCQYNAETRKLIEHQLESLDGSCFKFSEKLVNFKPDFSNESSSEKSRQILSSALKIILAFPEEDRKRVRDCLKKLEEMLKEIPANACPEVQDFFLNDVPIRFLDKTVPCKLCSILSFCSFSPVLYLAWKKSLNNHTPGVNFDKFGITYDDCVAIKNSCYNPDQPYSNNFFIGMALRPYLQIPKIEERYAGFANHSTKFAEEICEAYRKGYSPVLTPDLGGKIFRELGDTMTTSIHSPEVLMECLLIGSKIAHQIGRKEVRSFVSRFFSKIPEILTAFQKAIEDQLFEDVEDCESCIFQLVTLLEDFDPYDCLSAVKVIPFYIEIYQSLLGFDRVHPIPGMLERFRVKLSTIISVEFHLGYESILPTMMTVSDTWLSQKFTELMLVRLVRVSPEKLVRRPSKLDIFRPPAGI